MSSLMNILTKHKFFVLFIILLLIFIISYLFEYNIVENYSKIHYYSHYLRSFFETINGNKSYNTKYYNSDPLNEFKLMHKNIIQNKTEKIRVCINGYTPAGYANKMYSVLTSIVIAILTDSALIIRWHNIEKHIQEPLYQSFRNFDSEKNELSAIYKSQDLTYLEPKYAWIAQKDMDVLIKTELPVNKTRFLYDKFIAYFFEICSNPKYFNKLLYYRLVNKKSVDRALEAINSNSSTKETKLNDILRIGFEVGGNLLTKLWIPRKNILDLIQFYCDNFFKNNFVIGIQPRLFYLNENDDLNVFIECALEIEKKVNKTVKWFISSDSGHIIDKLISKYTRNKIIVANGTIGHVDEDQNAYQRAIIDNELLSKCDEIIITGGSTFGFLASIRQIKLPYYVNGHRGMKKCVKAKLSDPSVTPRGHSVF